MSLWQRIAQWIATTGLNITFRTFIAHAGFSYFVMSWAPGGWRWVATAVIVLVALWKEFWFDMKYEVPKQSIVDGITDFTGYTTGVILGLAHAQLI